MPTTVDAELAKVQYHGLVQVFHSAGVAPLHMAPYLEFRLNPYVQNIIALYSVCTSSSSSGGSFSKELSVSYACRLLKPKKMHILNEP